MKYTSTFRRVGVMAMALVMMLGLTATMKDVPAAGASDGRLYLEDGIKGIDSSGIVSYPARGSFSMEDETYFRGIKLDSYYREGSIRYYIAGQGITRLTGLFGSTTNGTDTGALAIIGDGILLGGYTVKAGEVVSVEVAIPAGVQYVTIKLLGFLMGGGSYLQHAFADAYFDNGTSSQPHTHPPAVAGAVYLQDGIFWKGATYGTTSYPGSVAIVVSGHTYFHGIASSSTIATYDISELGFTKLCGKFGQPYGSSATGTLTITGDGKLLGGIEYKGGDPVNVDVSIPTDVKELKLQFNASSGGNLAFVDAYFVGGGPAAPEPVTITATATPAGGGSVAGSGTYKVGDQVALFATAAAGWKFIGWYESGNSLSANANYAFAAATSRTLEARFEEVKQTPPEDLFNDDNSNDWAQDELYEAFESDLIPVSLLDPGKDLRLPVTRAEFAGVAIKVYEYLSGETVLPAATNPFTDTWDIDVLMAYNAGIMVGLSKTEFGPNSLLTREQAATALSRVYKRWYYAPNWNFDVDSMYPLQFEYPPPFADDAAISDWARESVYFMYAFDIIRGMGNNIFAPRPSITGQQAENYAIATREQAILIALRMAKNLQDT